MSRASLKELQSLALFGWDRQHDHAPNGELLNMPSHDEHTRFYQTGRQRRNRASSTGHTPGQAITPSQASKSKLRRPSTSLATTKRAPASRSRNMLDKKAGCEEASCRDEHPDSNITKYSPAKLSKQDSYAAQSTPRKMGHRDENCFQHDHVSSLSTTGIPSHHPQQSTCTPNLQVMEYSVSGCSVPKQEETTRSAGCTTMQSKTFKGSDTAHFASDPPSKSPLCPEYTPVLHSTADHSRVLASALPAATAPASPSSPTCVPSPPSPLAMAHSQENQPPGDRHAEQRQVLNDASVSLGPSSPSRPPTTAASEDICTADAAQKRADLQPQPDQFDVEQGHGLPAHEPSGHRPPQLSMDSPCGAMCCSAPEPQDMAAPSLATAAAQAEPQTCAEDADMLHRSCENAPPQDRDGPIQAAAQPLAPATEPHCPDKPPSKGSADDVMPGRPDDTQGPHEPAASVPCDPEDAGADASISVPAMPGTLLHSCTVPAEHRCAAMHISPMSALSQGQQTVPLGQPTHGGVATAGAGSRAAAACLELQQELDRHAMPPPKPKRARAQPLEAVSGQEKRACEAAGFWSGLWDAPRVDGSRVSLFQESRHLPLFQPSASLPSGNPWMLTFLP